MSARHANPGPPGSAFRRCVAKVSARGAAYDPKAVCAAAGRRKYGAKRFAEMAAAGRRAAAKRRARVRENPSSVVLTEDDFKPGMCLIEQCGVRSRATDYYARIIAECFQIVENRARHFLYSEHLLGRDWRQKELRFAAFALRNLLAAAFAASVALDFNGGEKDAARRARYEKLAVRFDDYLGAWAAFYSDPETRHALLRNEKVGFGGNAGKSKGAWMMLIDELRDQADYIASGEWRSMNINYLPMVVTSVIDKLQLALWTDGFRQVSEAIKVAAGTAAKKLAPQHEWPPAKPRFD